MHATSFESLPRTKAAREITERLGLGDMREEAACQGCHFSIGAEEDILASDEEGGGRGPGAGAQAGGRRAVRVLSRPGEGLGRYP